MIAPKDPPKTFSRLLAALGAVSEICGQCAVITDISFEKKNKATQGLFTNVLHVYEPTSDQSFFVNTIRFVSRIGMLSKLAASSSSSADIYPAFVQLHSPIRLVRNRIFCLPKKLIELNTLALQLERAPESLIHLLSDSFIPQPPSSLSFTLPPHVSLETAVPLAAVLLDYAVAYVPNAGHENVLSGIPLDFYECILAYHKTRGQEATHTIMKFSCPAGLTQGGPTSSERIIQELQTMFAERLSQSGDETMVVTVVHTVQSLDHVAI